MKFDVVIVGASSAGLYAAEQLARNGANVGVFERQVNLNPARRTYILTPHIKKVMGHIPEELILHRLDVMAVETPNAEVQISLRQPDLVIERHQMILYLAQKAKEAGARLYLGHEFQDMKGGALKFLTRNQTLFVESAIVIGADGAASRVAVVAGIEQPTTVPLVQAEIDLPSTWDPAVTKVWFDIDDTRFFYWLIPESVNHGVVGLIGEENSNVRVLLERFMKTYGFQAKAYQVGLASMHRPGLRPWGRVSSDERKEDLPVYLVGDAAGQVKVTTVGGTVTGFRGAQAVVEAILEDRPYVDKVKPLKRELDLHWFIRSLLEGMDNRGYDNLVQKMTPPVQRFLGEYDRDTMRGQFWKLPFIQPQFIILGLSLLYRFLIHQILRKDEN